MKANINDFIKSTRAPESKPGNLTAFTAIAKVQRRPRLHSIFDQRKFELIYDPSQPQQILANSCQQRIAVMALQEAGRQMLRRWWVGSSKRILTGGEIRLLFEQDRKQHFPRIKRPMMRAFQDMMVHFSRLGLVRKVK